MAGTRRPNLLKRQKEQKRAARAAQKRERRQERKRTQDEAPPEGDSAPSAEGAAESDRE